MNERTDTERLDWLETNNLLLGFHQFGRQPRQRLNKWMVWSCTGCRCQKLSTGESARLAIDNAMDAEERR